MQTGKWPHNSVVSLKTIAIVLLGPALSAAAGPSQAAEHAFDRYIANVESQLKKEILPGAIRVERVKGGSLQVAGGLLHHWRAAVFIPGATPKDMLDLLSDYDHLVRYYSPEVVSSHVLATDGTMTTLAMRLKKQQVITVVLDAEFQIESGLAGSDRGYSYSRSTNIWQIDQPGTAKERRLAKGADDGFLWRLNSYWSFERKGDGMVIECEAVSLTRAVPAGLGWLFTPIIATLPRDSLLFTLTATKRALDANAHSNSHSN